jgi:hypothetical protein
MSAADGNPDEDKIGAFGVGFYSLFSVTESPLVFSGGVCLSPLPRCRSLTPTDRGMRFYFKDGGDQLLVRRLHAPPAAVPDARPWTAFHMPLRTPGALPNAPDLVRFLAGGLVFMARLADVSVWLDARCLARVRKAAAPARALAIPRGVKVASPRGMMRMQGLSSTGALLRVAQGRC